MKTKAAIVKLIFGFFSIVALASTFIQIAKMIDENIKVPYEDYITLAGPITLVICCIWFFIFARGDRLLGAMSSYFAATKNIPTDVRNEILDIVSLIMKRAETGSFKASNFFGEERWSILDEVLVSRARKSIRAVSWGEYNNIWIENEKAWEAQKKEIVDHNLDVKRVFLLSDAHISSVEFWDKVIAPQCEKCTIWVAPADSVDTSGDRDYFIIDEELASITMFKKDKGASGIDIKWGSEEVDAVMKDFVALTRHANVKKIDENFNRDEYWKELGI